MRKEFWKRKLEFQKLNSKKWVRVRFWQGILGSLSLGKWMGDDPLFIGKQMGSEGRANDVFWREFMWVCTMKKV